MGKKRLGQMINTKFHSYLTHNFFDFVPFFSNVLARCHGPWFLIGADKSLISHNILFLQY